MILSHDEKQLVLYTKHWFEESQIIEDIKLIISKRTDTKVIYLTIDHVYQYMIHVFSKLVGLGYIKGGYERLLEEMFREKSSIDIKELVMLLHNKIRDIKTAGLNLGDPDPSYLPVANKI
jgi:hypothetical protein